MPVHSLEAARDWRTRQVEGDDTSAALRKERIRLVRLQSEKAELELSIRRGEFISRQENEESDAGIAQALSAMLRSYEKEIPQLCLGLPLSESRKLVEMKSRELQTKLSDHQSEYWRQHPLEQLSTRQK